MVIGKSNTYQRPLLIVAGFLLALFVWITITNKKGGHYFNISAQKIDNGADAIADYQVDTANLALTKDIFGVNNVSDNDEGKI